MNEILPGINSYQPTESDSHFMRVAIEQSRQSRPEDTKPHPKVGVVVVKDGKEVAKAHRGEFGIGDHAEYTALEKKGPDDLFSGSTVYTTLEPCTTRNHPKIPCVERIIERRVARVVIGILDPNKDIGSKGYYRLREAGIQVDLFPVTLMEQVEELNRDFIRLHRRTGHKQGVAPEFIEKNRNRDLDDWYHSLNSIYWNRNFHRDIFSLFTHQVEVIGGLSLLASQKKKPGLKPEEFITKALAWWLAVCGKAGVKSVSDMLWAKFPSVCPYCHMSPHDNNECREKKAASEGVDWQQLMRIGASKASERPKSLGQWQRMYSNIFPAQQTEDFGASFARLAEELGEMAEAVRVFPAAPGYFLSEASDVFAWLMHIQNIVESRAETVKAKLGDRLEVLMCTAYPDKCTDCGNNVCTCPPILESTIGRIAHEVPSVRGSFGEDGFFMTADKARAVFHLGRTLS